MLQCNVTSARPRMIIPTLGTRRFSLKAAAAQKATHCVDPSHRLHASLSHSVTRMWMREPGVGINAKDLVYPLFVHENPSEQEEIKALPGQYRLGVDRYQYFCFLFFHFFFVFILFL